MNGLAGSRGFKQKTVISTERTGKGEERRRNTAERGKGANKVVKPQDPCTPYT